VKSGSVPLRKGKKAIAASTKREIKGQKTATYREIGRGLIKKSTTGVVLSWGKKRIGASPLIVKPKTGTAGKSRKGCGGTASDPRGQKEAEGVVPARGKVSRREGGGDAANLQKMAQRRMQGKGGRREFYLREGERKGRCFACGGRTGRRLNKDRGEGGKIPDRPLGEAPEKGSASFTDYKGRGTELTGEEAPSSLGGKKKTEDQAPKENRLTAKNGIRSEKKGGGRKRKSPNRRREERRGSVLIPKSYVATLI